MVAVLPTEGRLEIVTNAGWDAVDAAASAREGNRRAASSNKLVSESGAQTNGAEADGEVVWS